MSLQSNIFRLSLSLSLSHNVADAAATHAMRMSLTLLKFQVKKALEGMGQGVVLHNITAQNVSDVVAVLSSIEVIGKRKKNCFQATHLDEVVRKIEPKPADSDLKKAVKGHITRTLVPLLKILQLTKKCKDIASLMKTSGMNDRLQGGTLKQEVDTRWMSVLMLLRSFFIWPSDVTQPPSEAKIDQVSRQHVRNLFFAFFVVNVYFFFLKINEILRSRKRDDLVLTGEDRTLQLQMVAILSPFETAIKKLEASKHPTIQHVIPRYVFFKFA